MNSVNQGFLPRDYRPSECLVIRLDYMRESCWGGERSAALGATGQAVSIRGYGPGRGEMFCSRNFWMASAASWCANSLGCASNRLTTSLRGGCP
jgi:hypothetical protein